MLKVSNSPGKPMSGKQLNNFGGKNPQAKVVNEVKGTRVRQTARGKSINNLGGKNPQKQGGNAMTRLFSGVRFGRNYKTKKPM